MADALNLIPVPDTSTMRALSQHLKVSAAPYNEHLQSLKANQKPLQENWQGDGTSAYVQSNGQLITIGDVHVEQMQRASSIIESTADLLDEGRYTQDAAELQWNQAQALKLIGQFVEAATLEAAARVMQATALATVSAARTLFNSGFASLTAEINTTPSMTGKSDDMYAVKGISLKQPSQKPAMTLPMTPPATPPATSPLTPVGSGDLQFALTVTAPPTASQPAQDAGHPSEPNTTPSGEGNLGKETDTRRDRGFPRPSDPFTHEKPLPAPAYSPALTAAADPNNHAGLAETSPTVGVGGGVVQGGGLGRPRSPITRLESPATPPATPVHADHPLPATPADSFSPAVTGAGAAALIAPSLPLPRGAKTDLPTDAPEDRTEVWTDAYPVNEANAPMEPPSVYREKEPEPVTEEGNPELTTEEGNPELATEKGEFELANELEESPPAYEEGELQGASAWAETEQAFEPGESLPAYDEKGSPPPYDESESRLTTASGEPEIGAETVSHIEELLRQ